MPRRKNPGIDNPKLPLTHEDRLEQAKARRALREQEVMRGRKMPIGGWKPGAGRKPTPPELRKVRVGVYLNSTTIRRLDIIQQITGNSRSRMIELMAEALYYIIYDDTNPLR